VTKSAVEQRIIRLVGDGKMSGSGALPLSDAFRGAMEQILDEGYAPFADLVKRVTDEMHTKERRIIALWGSWDAFTADIIEQLSYRKLVRPEVDHEETVADLRRNPAWVSAFRWHLAEGIVTGKSYDAITAGEVRKATGNKEALPFRVVLFDHDTRKQRDATARALTETNKWAAQLERLGQMDDAMRHIAHLATAHLQGTKVISERPSQPADEPGLFVVCKTGGEKLAKTKANFAVYWSRDQWYWRPTCREHLTGAVSRRSKVADIVRRLTEETGELPSTREVARQMGRKDDKTTRLDWDWLAAQGEIPPRAEVTARLARSTLARD
jgi:hypothetical protein